MKYLRIAILILLVSGGAANAQYGQSGQNKGAVFTPPFGLEWGEYNTHIAKLLSGAGARITDKHPVGQFEAWTVTGLIQTNLRRTIFYFQKDRLISLELQYQNKKWSKADYESFMNEIRQRIQKKFGQGKLVAHSVTPVGSVTQTIIGYKWSQNSTSLEIFFYGAKDQDHSYRTVSVHYKAY